MLTDEELDAMLPWIRDEIEYKDNAIDLVLGKISDLIAQAREANRLRAENETLTDRLAEIETVSPRGYEAEELRSGIEELMAGARENDEWRAELIKLLDRVDARDSLAVLVERDSLRSQFASAQQLLSLFGNQMAEMGKVTIAVDNWVHGKSSEHAPHAGLAKVSETYQAWLATHPHVNDAEIAGWLVGTVTVNADGTVKT